MGVCSCESGGAAFAVGYGVHLHEGSSATAGAAPACSEQQESPVVGIARAHVTLQLAFGVAVT